MGWAFEKLGVTTLDHVSTKSCHFSSTFSPYSKFPVVADCVVLEMTVAEYAALCSKETSTFHHNCVKKSEQVHKNRSENEEFPETHTATAVSTYLSYCILILYGHVRDFLRRIGLMTHGKMAIKDVSCFDIKC